MTIDFRGLVAFCLVAASIAVVRPAHGACDSVPGAIQIFPAIAGAGPAKLAVDRPFLIPGADPIGIAPGSCPPGPPDAALANALSAAKADPQQKPRVWLRFTGIAGTPEKTFEDVEVPGDKVRVGQGDECPTFGGGQQQFFALPEAV